MKDTPVYVLMDFILQFIRRKDSPTHPKISELAMDIFNKNIEYEFSMAEIEPYFHEFMGVFQRKW